MMELLIRLSGSLTYQRLCCVVFLHMQTVGFLVMQPVLKPQYFNIMKLIMSLTMSRLQMAENCVLVQKSYIR